ncbi:MAG: LPS export ABC transporter permease LptF [candidate division NC10 bacterium]|nr:LPS export ABC transporter permease LptF [candidate division NC10 bacterium]
MKIIDRYILEEMTSVFLAGLAIFTFVLLMGKILRLMELIITKGVGVITVLKLFATILPSFLALTVPMAGLLAALSAFGRLAADGELIALKTAGWSLYRLILPALFFGFLTYLLTLFLMLVAVPRSNHVFKDLVYRLARTKATLGLREGVYNSDFEGLILYVEKLDEGRSSLKGVFMADSRDPEAPRIIVAQEGQLVPDPRRLRMVLRLLQGGVHFTSPRDPAKYRSLSFATYEMALDLNPGLSESLGRAKGEAEMTLRELSRKINDLRAQGGNYHPYLVELHKKLALPLACLVFVLLGTPLGIKVKRSGRASGFLLSIPILLAYYILLVAGEGLGDRGRVPAFWAIWTPNLLLGVLGGLFLIAGARELSILERISFWRTRD